MEGSRPPACTTQVSFVCQRCSQPLKLDTSFKILDRLTIQELTGTGGAGGRGPGTGAGAQARARVTPPLPQPRCCPPPLPGPGTRTKRRAP